VQMSQSSNDNLQQQSSYRWGGTRASMPAANTSFVAALSASPSLVSPLTQTPRPPTAARPATANAPASTAEKAAATANVTPAASPYAVAAAVSKAYPHTPYFSLSPRFRGDVIQRPPTMPPTNPYNERQASVSPERSLSPGSRAAAKRGDSKSAHPPSDDEAEDPSGPRASDYARMRQSLEETHARNQVLRAAAQAKADASQAEFKHNQDLVRAAAKHLEEGLEAVEGNFVQRLDEYEMLLSNRTEVARSLNQQLRKRSKYAAAASTGGGASSEETVDSILDALSTWFLTRSSRALTEESLLAEAEETSNDQIERLRVNGGAEGTLESIFASVRFTPEMQEKLMGKLRETTASEVAQEHLSALATKTALSAAHQRMATDAHRIEALQDALERARYDRDSLIQKIDGRVISADGTASSPATSLRSVKAGSITAPSSSSSSSATPAKMASRAELESLLKKKLKALAELEKRRAKLAIQVHAQAKQALDKDRQVESLSSQVTKLTLQLSAGKEVHATTEKTNAHQKASLESREVLTKELLLRTSLQASEFGSLKLFTAHTLAEKEELRAEGYERERDAQVQRVREAFERLMEPPQAGAPGKKKVEATKESESKEAESSAAVPAPTGHTDLLNPAQLLQALHRSTGTSKLAAHSIDATLEAEQLSSVIQAMGEQKVEPELLTYVQRSGELIASSVVAPKTPPISSTSAATPSLSPASSHLSFLRFLSFTLRHHPVERYLERQRLCRRLREVFDGVDGDKDGKISISELETAARKENIELSKEQLDSVYLCLTAPDHSEEDEPHIENADPSLASAFLSLSSSTSASADSLTFRPITFDRFLSFFPCSIARGIFDQASKRVLGEAREENPTIRRHDRWNHHIMKERQAKLERERMITLALDPPISPTVKPRGSKLKPMTSVPPPSQMPRGGRSGDELDRAAAELDAENVLSSVGLFTHGTKDCLLHLFTFEPDQPITAPPAELLTIDYLDASVEAKLRSHLASGTMIPNATIGGGGSAHTVLERSVQALCHPLVNVRAQMEVDAMKEKMEQLKEKLESERTMRAVVAPDNDEDETSGPSSSTPRGSAHGALSRKLSVLSTPADTLRQRRQSIAVMSGLGTPKSERPGGGRKLSMFSGSTASPTLPTRRPSVLMGRSTNSARSPKHASSLASEGARPDGSGEASEDAKNIVVTIESSDATSNDSSKFTSPVVSPRGRSASVMFPRKDPSSKFGTPPISALSSKRGNKRPSADLTESTRGRSSARSSTDLPTNDPAAEALADSIMARTRAQEEAEARAAASGGMQLDGNELEALTAKHLIDVKKEREEKQRRRKAEDDAAHLSVTGSLPRSDSGSNIAREKDRSSPSLRAPAEQHKRASSAAASKSSSSNTSPRRLSASSSTATTAGSKPPTSTVSPRRGSVVSSPPPSRPRSAKDGESDASEASSQVATPRSSTRKSVPSPASRTTACQTDALELATSEYAPRFGVSKEKVLYSTIAGDGKPAQPPRSSDEPVVNDSGMQSLSSFLTQEEKESHLTNPHAALGSTSAALEQFQAAYLHRLMSQPVAGERESQRKRATFDRSLRRDSSTPAADADDSAQFQDGVEARQYHAMYHAERMRVQQLERTLRLLSTAQAAQPPARLTQAHLGGSLTARSRPTSAAIASPRSAFAMPPSGPSSSSGDPYADFISRRYPMDGIRTQLLHGSSLVLPQPQIPAQVVSRSRPKSAFFRG
jgi:hypothetical protein